MIRRVVLIAALAACSSPAFAAGTYDPHVDYLTITTPNYHVVYPEGYEHIAIRTASIAEGLVPHLTARYGYTLKDRTTIIINDQTDFANGSATVSPLKVVTIFVTAPTETSGLEDYDDWLHNVIVHELAHIYHLDMVFGLPWVGRLIFGKYVSMNLYTPAWVSEGLAVYEETISSGSGRGRSSYVDMVMRVAALEDRFPTIDQAFRAFSNWPFSNVAYFIGGKFQLWLAEKYGEDALMQYHRAHAASPIPYFTWLPAKIAFDTSLESLWLAFVKEITEDAQLKLASVKTSTPGLTQPQRLTRYGGDLAGPRITPDGRHVIFSTFSPKDGARVRRITIDGHNDEALVNDTFSLAISFTPDGRAFYFQQTEINQRFYQHNSILRYNLANGTLARVHVLDDDKKAFTAPSGSLRVRDPDVSPDGKRIVFVQTPYGANRLVLAWLETNGATVHPRVIVPAEPDVQFSNPRFSPDGQRIAVSRFRGGRRDIVLYDLHGKLVLELTRDRAQDIDPEWSRDGRWLLFASDRNGIYNLYAYHLETQTLRRLTNLISGAYQPSLSADMSTIVFRGYSADGFDVYRVPFEPQKAPLVPLDRQPPELFDAMPRRWPPTSETLPSLPPPAPFKDTPVPEKLPAEWTRGEYSAWDTLPPWHDNWNLLPVLQANEREIFGRITHIGVDAMETQRYGVSASYGTATQAVGGSVAYINDAHEPTFGLFADTDAVSYGLGPDVYYDERRYSATALVSIPVRQRHQISMSYVFDHHQPLRSLREQGLEQLGVTAGDLPEIGRFNRLQLGYAYSNYRFFPHSISPERGWSAAVALLGLTPLLGSNFEQISVSSEVRGYLTMPWRSTFLQNHVLAARMALLLSDGPDAAYTGRMGGVAGASALTTTTQDFYPLRGARTAGQSGSALLNGGLEYRAPILRVERGYGTLAAVLRVLHLAAFCDFGRVLAPLANRNTVSIGGELRADVLLAYHLELELRLGYAHLLQQPKVTFGVADCAGPDAPNGCPGRPERRGLDASGLYFQIGSTF